MSEFKMSKEDLQPTSTRTMRDIIRGMGAENWLNELGKCYKWLETQHTAYKGMYKAYFKAVEDVGGAAGIIAP